SAASDVYKRQPFARYGFNKSHSAAYAYLAYQTAYLKAHYPLEFMSANLTLAMGKTDKIVNLINDCRNMLIKILPPDINESNREFTISDGSIRFGLEAVKGGGVSAIEIILEERQKGKFKDLKDFLKRIDTRKVNKRVTENLIKAGVFDSLFEDDTLIKRQNSLINLCKKRSLAMEILNGDNGNSFVSSLFDNSFSVNINNKTWDEQTLLKNENEALGFYISGHPLLNHRKELNQEGVRLIHEIQSLEDRFETTIAGIVNDIKVKSNTKGQTTYINLEDETGSCDCLLFNGSNKKNLQMPEIGQKVIIKGQVLKAEKGSRMMIKDIIPITDHADIHDMKYYLDYTIESDECIDELAKIRKLLIDSENVKDCFIVRLHMPDYCVSIMSCLKPCDNFELELSKIANHRATLSLS
ncbi:MAG: OB-fold nucleic acid binding domain-containing protein, partial [Thermodesulfovibrionales bacterium]|nr:OB-fold nucleic acid binding domain-containing protein [Thermodesulfovibrionales bacterium]